MTTPDLVTHLLDFLANATTADPHDDPIVVIHPDLIDPATGVADATRQASGVVVRTKDGREFQVRVVRTK